MPVGALVAVAAVLIHGAFDHPPPAEAAPRLEVEPAPAPVSVSPPRPESERIRLGYQADYWLQLGERG